MNRARLSILFASALLATSLSGLARDASACAVLTPDQSIPVTGHKMILSLSKDRTFLWDQFTFTGTPESFAWILPVKGPINVAVSSDALFDIFGQITAPQVFAPQVCANSCDGGGGANSGGVVDVVVEEVVGPYQTVQLASNDPNALKDWLQTNGYPIPDAVKPMLDAYVAEGFGFVAIKLLPGLGIDSVQPVRIDMDGAVPSVPIRLLAAGTGDLTQVTLWVVSDGKYLPKNAPVATIASSELEWDFATDSSNYDAVRKAKLAASGGLAYLVEQGLQREASEFRNPLEELVNSDPLNSGYGPTQLEAENGFFSDMDAMYGYLSNSPWITRLSADLSREALKTDLVLEAAADQTPAYGIYKPSKYVNEDQCPPDPCAMGGSGGTGGGGGDATGGNATGGNGSGNGGNGGDGSGNSGQGANANDPGTQGGCSVPGAPAGESAALGLVFALGLALRRRRAAR
jgi:MYXO-CTERM domain-containing protein